MPLTNALANKHREKDCFAITAERKYFQTGNGKCFVKRSLRPSEWQVSHIKGTIHVPRLGNERLLNEAAAMEYIRDNTDIPVPKLYSCFEDDNAVYLVMEYVEGVEMSSLDDAQRSTVADELEIHLQALQNLRSSTVGGPTGIIVPPYRAMRKKFRDSWTFEIPASPTNDTTEFVFCHNDLSQQNVIVDPSTLKIKAIIDWEYAGFWPEYFERRFFERKGPSVALECEEDDFAKLIKFLLDRCVP